MNNKIVMCDTYQSADRLMKEFLSIIEDDPEFDHASRTSRKIYYTDGRYVKFAGYAKYRQETDGFRGEIVPETIFRLEMNDLRKRRSKAHETDNCTLQK